MVTNLAFALDIDASHDELSAFVASAKAIAQWSGACGVGPRRSHCMGASGEGEAWVRCPLPLIWRALQDIDRSPMDGKAFFECFILAVLDKHYKYDAAGADDVVDWTQVCPPGCMQGWARQSGPTPGMMPLSRPRSGISNQEKPSRNQARPGFSFDERGESPWCTEMQLWPAVSSCAKCGRTCSAWSNVACLALMPACPRFLGFGRHVSRCVVFAGGAPRQRISDSGCNAWWRGQEGTGGLCAMMCHDVP